MKTVILAGGFGTRLQPVLKGLPKPLAPVNSQCFLEYLLEYLKKNEFYDYIFCLHHMAGKIIEYFGRGDKMGVRIYYSIEENPMGTGGAIGLLRGILNEAFCVVNADTYLELDMKDYIEVHKNSGALATIAVTKVTDICRYGRVELDHDGYVKNFLEKENGSQEEGYINAGMYIFEPGIFAYIPEKQFISLEKEVFPALLQVKEKIKSYSKVENFFDIGIPSDYENFQQWINNAQP